MDGNSSAGNFFFDITGVEDVFYPQCRMGVNAVVMKDISTNAVVQTASTNFSSAGKHEFACGTLNNFAF